MANDPNNKEDKCVFALGQGRDNEPVVIVGITRAAWINMIKKKKTATFDFSKAGLNIKLVMFGGQNHAAIMKEIQHLADLDHAEMNDLTDLDTEFGIQEEDDDGPG